ncbi:MAG TPA: two-component regulator propeller domain-containing protein [Pyrinomonadaceae bacterium]
MQEASRRRRHVIPPGLVLACILLAWCPSAFALNPTLDVNQYAHTSWKLRDGFTKGQIISTAQTPDGYLWLGTEFGLLRFDGVRNVPWQPPADQQLPSSYITSLLGARDGTLWIGALKGLASWKDGKLTQYPELAGQDIFKLLEDHEGTVWASGRSVTNGKLCAIRNGSVRCHGEDGALGRGAFNLYEDSKGNLWAGVKDGLWRWRPEPPQFYPLPGEPDGIQALGEDDDGALLVGWNGGIQRLVDGKPEAYPLPDTVGHFRARRMLRDRDGGLWIGTQGRGLVHVHQGRTDVFAPSDGLSGELIYNLLEDREGNVWVATRNGLDRFRDVTVATLTVSQGLTHPSVGAVLADRDGSVWLATRGGLNRLHDGQITSYGRRGAQPSTGNDRRDGRQNEYPNTLFQDDQGRIWASTSLGFGYLENDRFISVSGLPGGPVTAIAQDTDGSLWIANEHVALFQLLRGAVVRQIPWATLGHKDHASTLAADPLQGGLWLGYHLGGVAYFSEGQVRASYAAADGLGEGRVNHLRLEQDGTLWAATKGGLSRLKNGRVATLTSRHGLPCDTIHWATEDDAHSFWLYTACGLVRVARAELDAWAAAVEQGNDAGRTLQPTVFDSSDGVRILASTSHFSPQVAKSSDGRLWFLPWDGVSVVDPKHLSFNQLPPPVHIEHLIADRKTYGATSESSGRVQLPPLIRDLEIGYTALSLVAPEKVLFRYKLEGHDADWLEAGNRRQAFYNDLPPGDYRFRVMACNNNGVWNEAGTFLDFSVAPAYYQTTWFRVSSVSVFLLLLVSLYQLRLRQVARQVRGRMEERLAERERIARDLHDTLLQSVQGLILKFHAVATQMRGDDPAYEALEKSLDQADLVLAEGRDRVRNLRGVTVPFGGLPAAFQRVVEETPQGSDVTFKTVVEGGVRELHPIIREEAYCIGREALVNALTHSAGRHVEVEITYEPRQFRLRVRDDGCGIDPAIIEEGRPDHWGLRGMRERAQRIGAQLNFWSRAETGTEVELTIPGATAYQVPGAQRKRFWFRRHSGIDE